MISRSFPRQNDNGEQIPDPHPSHRSHDNAHHARLGNPARTGLQRRPRPRQARAGTDPPAPAQPYKELGNHVRAAGFHDQRTPHRQSTNTGHAGHAGGEDVICSHDEQPLIGVSYRTEPDRTLLPRLQSRRFTLQLRPQWIAEQPPLRPGRYMGCAHIPVDVVGLGANRQLTPHNYAHVESGSGPTLTQNHDHNPFG